MKDTSSIVLMFAAGAVPQQKGYLVRDLLQYLTENEPFSSSVIRQPHTELDI
jgi:hypothetical protein